MESENLSETQIGLNKSVEMINFGPEVYAFRNRTLVRKEFTFGLPHRWQKEGFNYKKYIEERKNGFFIEVAGPTESWETASPKRIDNFFVSNIKQMPGINFVADARDLPFQKSSLDGIFVSCLGNAFIDPQIPGSVRDERTQLLFKESIKCLKSGGILVYQHGFRYIVQQAITEGFELVKFQRRDGFKRVWNMEDWNCVFRKPYLT